MQKGEFGWGEGPS